MRARECSTREAWIFARNFRPRFLRFATFSHTPECFLSEKPNRFSLVVNTRPRGKIQIPAASAPRDGKLSFAHFCISFITLGRENAYGIVGGSRNALRRVVVFSSPSNRAPVFGLRFFNLPGLSTRALYNVRGVSFRAIA